MNIRYFALFSLGLAVLPSGRPAPPASQAQVVIVNANRVNVRATPKENGELVGQVNFEDRLIVKSFLGEWVEIVPPAGIKFYVHGDFLKDNQVTAPILHVRSGPSVNYSVVGQLVRNQQVLPRGVFNEWIEIAPPENASVWVHHKFVKQEPVKPPPARPGAEAPKPAPPQSKPAQKPPVVQPAAPLTPPPSAIVEKQSDHKVLPPYDLELIPLEGQGKLVKRQGYLKVKTGVFARSKPSKYRLEIPYKGKTDLVCYVKDEGPDMQDYVEKWVIIQGHEYWVQGEGRPVIVPKAVVISNRPADY